MLLNDTTSFTISATHLSQSEEKELVDVHQLIGPERVLVENVGGEQFRRDTARKIFQPFSVQKLGAAFTGRIDFGSPDPSTFDSTIITVGFRIGFLQ